MEIQLLLIADQLKSSNKDIHLLYLLIKTRLPTFDNFAPQIGT